MGIALLSGIFLSPAPDFGYAPRVIGQVIKSWRERAGFSQQELAQRVEGGMSLSMLSKIERNEHASTRHTLRLISEALGKTLADLDAAVAGEGEAALQKLFNDALATAGDEAVREALNELIKKPAKPLRIPGMKTGSQLEQERLQDAASRDRDIERALKRKEGK